MKDRLMIPRTPYFKHRKITWDLMSIIVTSWLSMEFHGSLIYLQEQFLRVQIKFADF